MIDLCVCDAENRLYENEKIDRNEKVIFVTDKCSVVEKNNDGYYTYYAVNHNTLKKKHISKRNNPIRNDEYEKYAQKADKLEINKDMNLEITRYDRAINLLRHIFLYILPNEGFSFRKNQFELAVEIFDSLEHKKVALMEAEVGTGKTHAYIIAVIIYNLFHDVAGTTLISTSTIALQKAVTEEYIPQISDILMKYRIIKKPINFVVRKGKSHYVCDLKLKTYLSSLRHNNNPDDEKLIKTLQNLTRVDESKIDLDAYSLTRYVKDRICVTNKCSEICSKYDYCRYISFTQKCLYGKYYFQIANHNYVFADRISFKRLLPEYKTVIFDEAHKLYEVAKQMYGCYLSFSELEEITTYVKESKSDVLNKYTDSIYNVSKRLFDRMKGDNASGYERQDVVIDMFCIGYMHTLTDKLTYISDNIYSCDDIKSKHRKRIIKKISDSIRNKLQVFMFPEQLICWLELTEGSYRLCSIPKDLSKNICQTFWKSDCTSVLTSGTLSVNGNFGLMKNKLGIDLIDNDMVSETSKKSPFEYNKNALIYIPEHMPFPNMKSEKYVEAVIKEIDRLLKAAFGHSLVLFTSYRLMELVFNNIGDNDYGFPLFIMGRGRIDALRDFKMSGNGVLFASDSAGEGVDIVGDTLSNLIVVKLPFSVPDPISKYEQSVLGGLDNYLKTINTPNMIIKLKQYAGRLIRSENDTGVVSILDSRVSTKGKYRSIVLDSLFDADITNNIRDVERFIMDKKGIDYFE